MISTPSFPRRRESSKLNNSRKAGQTIDFVRYAKFFTDWIP
jgi:hypothetical protein